ncbi:hypothetical protein [Flagellimonas sp.]|uniref:hypothetical protein n=1 Tax=Flagellimonas sp. TaxID=2058762 RepID=UPI003BAF7134
MKKLHWFTHTNIDTRRVKSRNALKKDNPKVSIDLSHFIEIFAKNEIWKRKKYRTEYSSEYSEQDVSKLKSIKVYFYSEEAPYSNGHSYESIINNYVDLNKIETSKITSSGIGDAFQIAVIETEIDTSVKVIDYLTHEEERDIEKIFEKKLTNENIDSWHETNRIKGLISEFLQFLSFNMHLNFRSINYSFSFTEKPLQTGFTVLSDQNSYYYETDKIDFLGHYIYYESEIDQVLNLMNESAKFWHKEIPTIHFFLDALKGSYVTINNFSKLVFTLESFFREKTSSDYITLTVPLLVGNDIRTMKEIRETLKLCFRIRNNYVHGKEIIDLRTKLSKGENIRVEEMFYKLKNIIIQLFTFYIKHNLFLMKNNEKINHELVFRLLPEGIKN